MKNRIITTVFILLLAASVSLLVYGSGDVNGENRVSATLPPLTRETAVTGEFAAGADAYVNDHIAYRSDLISLSRQMDAHRGVESPAGTIIRADVDMGTGVKQASDILVENGAVTEMFRFDEECAVRWANAVNAYADELDGVKIYAALVPTRLEFADPIYSNLEDSQSDAIEYIYSRLDGGITAVDMRAALAPHTGEYIYFRTDHHWTALGAYYGYAALCRAAGVKTVGTADFKKNTKSDFHGYLSDFVADKKLLTNPDTLDWYDVDPSGEITNSMRAYEKNGSWHEYHTPIYYTERNDYDFFLGADHPYAVYKNPSALSDKTILVVSDSFINALAPWLMKSYSTVAFINPRSYYGTLKSAADELKPDDFLVLNYTFASSFPDYCAAMERLTQ